MRLLNRPWTIVAVVVLYLARPALLDINTLAIGASIAPGAVYTLAGFTIFSTMIAIGLWLRWRPARIAALIFDAVVLAAIGVGVLMFLLTFLFWIVLLIAVVVGGLSGAVVWLLTANPTKRWFFEQAAPS